MASTRGIRGCHQKAGNWRQGFLTRVKQCWCPRWTREGQYQPPPPSTLSPLPGMPLVAQILKAMLTKPVKTKPLTCWPCLMYSPSGRHQDWPGSDGKQPLPIKASPICCWKLYARGTCQGEENHFWSCLYFYSMAQHCFSVLWCLLVFYWFIVLTVFGIVRQFFYSMYGTWYAAESQLNWIEV